MTRNGGGPGPGELFQLLSQLVDGTMSEAEVSRLRDLLRDHPEQQDVYLGYMSLHAHLHLGYGSGATPASMPGGSSMPDASSPAWPLGAAGLRVVGGPRGAGVPARWRLALALAFAGGLAAAVIAAGLALPLWQEGRPKGGLAPTAPLVERQAPARVGPRAGVAMVVNLDGVLWEGGGLRPAEGEIVEGGGRLSLGAGRLTLAFFNGVTLTVEGPADLDVASLDRVFCRRGKVRTHVPTGAEGFVVAAPGSNVTDLGTEFGFNVEAGGKAQVMVFEGSADAAVLEASGSAQRNRGLRTRAAVEIDPQRFALTDSDATAESFVAIPSLASPGLRLDPVYRDEVLRARPWGYWRFESLDGGLVPNEVADRPPLRATGPVRLAGEGNRSAAFGPGVADQYLLMDGSFSPPHEPGYAVELWFAPERIGLAALAGLFIPQPGAHYDHLILLELTAQNRESFLFQRTSVRFLHRWPPSFQGGDNLFADHYVPYRWHHAVAQLRGGRMELFINGSPSATLGSAASRDPVECRLVLGQLKPSPRPPQPWESRPFVGLIDEVAVYDRPLSPEEVRRHYALKVPDVASRTP